MNVEELNWSARSPDVNFPEHLWNYVERPLRARHTLPTTTCQLFALLQD